MNRLTRRALAAATGAAVACTVATAVAAAPADATTRGAALTSSRHHAPTVKVLDSTLGAPYQLDAARGAIYIGDGGLSKVLKYSHGRLSTVTSVTGGGDVSGVAINKRGDLAYTTTVGDENGISASGLVIKPKHGAAITVDTKAFENAHNPDAGVTYGIDNPTQCQQDAFAPLGGANYPGIADSHAYAVTDYGRDAWLVADAGGNDILKVDRRGHISVVAVLPRQATTITADAAAGLGLPDCVVGAVYNFEAVPTDVEVGPHGKLIVSLLPGGPEDPSLGARGAVYSVNPWNGHAHRLAGGFLGATNVAVGPRGRIYVAELFAGQVSVIDHGSVSKYVDLPGALSLVWSKGGLYAGTLGPTDENGAPTGPGTLVRIS